MGDGVDDRFPEGEVRDLRKGLEPHAVEALYAADLRGADQERVSQRVGDRGLERRELTHIPMPTGPSLGPEDAEEADAGPRMRPVAPASSEEEQGGVREPPVARPMFDQPIMAEGIDRRPPSERRPFHEASDETQVQRVQGGIRAEPRLIAATPIRLLLRIYGLLPLADDLRPDAVREPVPFDRDRFGRHAGGEDQDLEIPDPSSRGAAGDATVESRLGDGEQAIHHILGIAVARRSAVVLHAHEQHAAVRVGERGDRFRDLVAERPPWKRRRPVSAPIPGGLELEELPFAALDQRCQFRLGVMERRPGSGFVPGHRPHFSSAPKRSGCVFESRSAPGPASVAVNAESRSSSCRGGRNEPARSRLAA